MLRKHSFSKNKIKEMILQAAKIAIPEENDKRLFWLGCIGIRKDGKIVQSKNGSVISSEINPIYYKYLNSAHAECRVVRKMDYGGILYVARVARKDRTLKMSRPCLMCQMKIKSKGIRKVYYSINEFQYGVWDVAKNVDIVYNY